MSERIEILKGLKPLFDKARKEKLWFYCGYQGMWFAPDELEAYHKDNKFVWGAVNWQLRNPKEQLDNLKMIVENSQKNVVDFKERMEAKP